MRNYHGYGSLGWRGVGLRKFDCKYKIGLKIGLYICILASHYYCNNGYIHSIPCTF